jgi:ubiquinone/menaquinone biosynthesis C-methylase UbiE
LVKILKWKSRREELYDRIYSMEWGDTTTNNYGFAPAEGHQRERFQTQLYTELLNLLDDRLDFGRIARVLEISCGRGGGLGHLARHLPPQVQVIGLDFSAHAIAFCRERYAAVANLAFVRGHALQLPFADGSFDLVLGHAVLHHLPGLDRALAEFHRVLAPGGTLAFMGEPSAHGDRLAAMPKRLGALLEPAWRRAMRATPTAVAGSGAPAEETYGALEGLVDVHTFTPGALQELAHSAGFTDVRVSGEELLANVYGWFLRRLEADVDATIVPLVWHRFAFSSYLALQWVDGKLLESRLPAELFYNLLISARRPG